MAADDSASVMQNWTRGRTHQLAFAAGQAVNFSTHLLHLLKLMHSEDTPSVLSMLSCLLSETGRVASVPDSGVESVDE
jgi:hypothetical protein